jgi:hypothetical protein
MNPSRPDDSDLLAPEDRAFVHRIADSYTPPVQSPGRRASFHAELEARIARDRWRLAPWAAAALAAGTAALLVVARLPAAPHPHPQNPITLEEAADADSDEEIVLALGGSSDDFDSSLPADYQAISSMLEPQ